MSAWARLVAKAEDPEEVAELNAALLEIQTETARRLAKKIRDRNNEVYGISGPLFATEAADLVDPDVD
jgi:hypothetical protein